MTATVRGVSIDDRSGSINQDGHREYRITYKVTVDDKRDGLATVRTAFGIPNLGDSYNPGNDSDFAAVVVSKEPRLVEWPLFEVEVIYSTDVGQREPIQYATPLDEPPEITFGFEERRILIPGRFNDPLSPPSGRAWEQGIFAPNGELFDPQPEVPYCDPVWHIKKNFQNISYVGIMALANCVNADFYNGAEPRTLKLKPPQAARKWHKVIGFYWEVSYSIIYRWETWDVQLLNQGTFFWTGGKPTSLWSSTVLPKVKPIPGGGVRVVNLSTNGDINSTSTPTFTRIRYFREIQFSTLQLI